MKISGGLIIKVNETYIIIVEKIHIDSFLLTLCRSCGPTGPHQKSKN